MCGRFALGQQHIDFLEALDAQYPRIFRRQPGGRAPQRLRGGGPEDDSKPDVKSEDAEIKPAAEDNKSSMDEAQTKEENPQAEELESCNAAGDESNAPNNQEAAEADAEVKPKGEDDEAKPDTKTEDDLKWHAAPALGFKWKREQDFWPR